MGQTVGALVNTILIALVSGLAGWVLNDLRNRMVRQELKMAAVVMGLFYLVMHNPSVPVETKRALEVAMGGK